MFIKGSSLKLCTTSKCEDLILPLLVNAHTVSKHIFKKLHMKGIGSKYVFFQFSAMQMKSYNRVCS